MVQNLEVKVLRVKIVFFMFFFDFFNLVLEVKFIEECGVDWFYMDVMVSLLNC